MSPLIFDGGWNWKKKTKKKNNIFTQLLFRAKSDYMHANVAAFWFDASQYAYIWLKSWQLYIQLYSPYPMVASKQQINTNAIKQNRYKHNHSRITQAP